VAHGSCIFRHTAGGRRLRCGCAAAVTAGAPIAAATARTTKEKGHAECDKQKRADEVKHDDGDEAKVLGDAERTNDDECGQGRFS